MLRRRSLEESATTTTWREMRIISALSSASARCGVMTPISGSKPSAPRYRRSACRFASAACAMCPDSELDSRRSVPPGMIRRTDGTSIRSAAMFSALVITLIERSSSLRIRRAISAVVVPESRMMVSPSRISAAAASAMRRFSAWCCSCLTPSGWSSSSTLTAPPCVRVNAPADSSAARSARIVTSEVPKRAASPSTTTLPCSRSSAQMRRRRSSINRPCSSSCIIKRATPRALGSGRTQAAAAGSPPTPRRAHAR